MHITDVNGVMFHDSGKMAAVEFYPPLYPCHGKESWYFLPLFICLELELGNADV